METHMGVSQPTRGYHDRRRVMIVDESEDSREVLARFLESLGHEVCTAMDGPQALQAAARFHPEIVFLDLHMPHMSGVETCERLREDSTLGDLVVFATTTAAPHGLDHFDACLTKPLECEVIQALISSTPRVLES